MEITKEQFESLASFVFDVLEDFPDIATLDGFDIQDIAVTRNVLIPTTVYEPCQEEGCNCAEFYSDDDFKAGATCYKLADWLRRVAEQRDAPVQSEQGEQSPEAKCTTERLCPVHNIWHAARPNRSDGG